MPALDLKDLTPQAAERAIDDLYAQVSGRVAEAVHAVSLARYSIPREKRRIGPREFPYHLAADIDLLFRFARGEADASATYVGGLCDRLLALLHTAPAGRLPEDWEALSATPLGCAIRAARARVKLRDDDEALTHAEIEVLSGLSSQKIAAAKLPRRKGAHSSTEVRAWFQKEGIRA